MHAGSGGGCSPGRGGRASPGVMSTWQRWACGRYLASILPLSVIGPGSKADGCHCTKGVPLKDALTLRHTTS